METKRLLAGLIALLVLALPAIAQTSVDTEKESREAEKKMRDAERQMRDAERQMREAARVLARFHADKEVAKIDRRVVVFDDHARLGVVLRSEADPKTDSIGAYLEALSPGSPAEEAGLRPGDIITKFNSQALAATKGDEDVFRSIP